MLFTPVTTVLLLTLFNGALALPISTTTSATVASINAFDLSASRGITALKELAAEQSTIFGAPPSQWNAVARRISEKTENAISTTRFSASQMRAAHSLGSVDALALWQPVQALTNAADETMKNFSKMKSIVFQMNNGPSAVLGLLQGMKESSREFTVAMSSKMPLGFNYVGEHYGNSVGAMVGKTIKEYQSAPSGSVWRGNGWR